MTILFISDVHLCIEKPDITSSFLYFLYNRTSNVTKLYILGDLFETWIGDDENNILHQKISIALKYLWKQGIRCYFIHGNKDFLLGAHYANTCNLTLLPTYFVLQLTQYRVIILHGDILCTNDSMYQFFRYIVHFYYIQKLFLLLPISIRKYIATLIRIKSIKYNNIKKRKLFNIEEKTVVNFLIKNNSVIMIHGHTHKSKIQYINNYKDTYIQITLGKWNQKKGSILEIDGTDIRLFDFYF